ncbi:hypothetical protein K493DRAFT_373199 [Basidiobolus meristosporus CBS 931.73]|uniref:G-protein coupled receptors family 2 profile 2 domain-containing protein n=1 Tax=Basidiobolus meristosporus CBS 931.73 TaxID=1314790 RepID=A0A1Y1YA57_9FUNG|nr:hypothetical protein K493DRAFT_373199 [Basidiobolus meristosporus CBS 931.73]|eukprot:ORX94795.1 hypothetical protein K493DRAFT_373199 [Basidiobolus meristosporus CBS 931.73]
MAVIDPNAQGALGWEMNPEDRQRQDTFMQFVKFCSIASFAITVLVFILSVSFYIARPQITNKISFKLTMCVVLFEMIFHGTTAYRTQESLLAIVPSQACFWIRLILNFSKIMIVLLTCTIAFNLDLVFIHQKLDASRYHKWYIPFSLCTGLALTIPSAIYSYVKGVCWLGDPSQSLLIALEWWIANYVWLIIGLIYSLIVVVRVIRVLRRHEQYIEAFNPHETRMHENLKRVIFRIIMYVTIPIITFTPAIISFFFQTIGFTLSDEEYGGFYAQVDTFFWILAEGFTTSTGILTGLVFSLDPVVKNVYLSFGKQARRQPELVSKFPKKSGTPEILLRDHMIANDIDTNVEGYDIDISIPTTNVSSPSKTLSLL